MSRIGLQEIKTFAETSLTHIQRIEDMGVMTPRKKLFFGSAGDQQSLLYKQVWVPFSDEQHGKIIFIIILLLILICLEVVLDVLSDWYRHRGGIDDHYMWNVTLPGKTIFPFQE